MKKIGFLSFGHWNPSPHSQARTASDVLLQSIELAVAAEEVGADGAYFRVHHFANQLASPFPLLAAAGARTSRIELGTGVIDMRYENPLYMAEDAGAADLIAGGRLQLGISRGSPEQVIEGYKYFGYDPGEGNDHADMAREHARVFLDVIDGKRFAEPNPRPMFPNPPGLLGIEPQSPGLRDRIWWGAGTRKTAVWTGEQGMNLMSSTLLTEDTGVPFHQLQAEQIQMFRDAWKEAGHAREPRVSVSRSIFPIVNGTDRAYFGGGVAEPGPGRVHRRRHGPVRQDVRRGAGPARQGPRRGRGDRRRGHAAADDPEPARRRLQRAPAGQHRQVRRTGAGLALTIQRGLAA